MGHRIIITWILLAASTLNGHISCDLKQHQHTVCCLSNSIFNMKQKQNLQNLQNIIKKLFFVIVKRSCKTGNEGHNVALCSDPKCISDVSCLSLCQWTIYLLTSERKTIPPDGLFQRPIVYSSGS